MKIIVNPIITQSNTINYNYVVKNKIIIYIYNNLGGDV